jgi:hypothetical protein
MFPIPLTIRCLSCEFEFQPPTEPETPRRLPVTHEADTPRRLPVERLSRNPWAGFGAACGWVEAGFLIELAGMTFLYVVIVYSLDETINNACGRTAPAQPDVTRLGILLGCLVIIAIGCSTAGYGRLMQASRCVDRIARRSFIVTGFVGTIEALLAIANAVCFGICVYYAAQNDFIGAGRFFAYAVVGFLIVFMVKGLVDFATCTNMALAAAAMGSTKLRSQVATVTMLLQLLGVVLLGLFVYIRFSDAGAEFLALPVANPPALGKPLPKPDPVKLATSILIVLGVTYLLYLVYILVNVSLMGAGRRAARKFKSA